MESNAIRLTNRTAIALRRQAKRTRNAYFVMGAVGTLLLLALALLLGFDNWRSQLDRPRTQ